MCLHISNNSTKLKRKARREGKKIIAYKLLRVRGNRLYSPYMSVRWPRNSVMTSNRKGKDPTRMTKNEGSWCSIYQGLHFHGSLLNARESLCYFDKKVCIYKVEIDPKDIIAFSGSEVAAHKARIIGLVRKPRKK